MADELKPNLSADQTPPVPLVPKSSEIPKDKSGWDKLRTDDPQRWGDLTQERMDQTFRQSRETQEKLAAAEERERNLLAQIQANRQPPPVADPLAPVEYGNGKYPQTEDEWNNLFIEKPVFATDLRHTLLKTQDVNEQVIVSERQKTVDRLTQEHSDMYHYEIDGETGKPRLDTSGKPILDKDPNTVGYAYNTS